MKMTFHKITDALENIGLKRVYNDSDVVKFSYGDCKATFITIHRSMSYCTIFRQLQISRHGEYYTNESINYDLLNCYMNNPISIGAILSEMKILITQYKELKIKYKIQQIEEDFEK